MVCRGHPAPAAANGETQYVLEHLYISMISGVLYIEQEKARSSGTKVTEELPPPMTHVVNLPTKYQKYIKR